MRRSAYEFKKSWEWPYSLYKLARKKLQGLTINVCCGKNDLGDVRIDILPEMEPDIIADMWYLPVRNEIWDTVICDPPWKIEYNKRQDLLYRIRDLLRLGGQLIWNAPFWPRIKCLVDTEFWVRVPNPGGSCYRHLNVSVLVIARKTQGQLLWFVGGTSKLRDIDFTRQDTKKPSLGV